MKQVTITLDDDVYKFLELRFAIDDLRIQEGIEEFLTEIAMAKIEKRPIIVDGKEIYRRAA